MNRRLIDGMSLAMSDVYASVVDAILVNLARHFKFIQEGAPVSGSWEYQVRKLAELGAVTRETEEIILDRLGGADETLRKMLETAIMDGLKDSGKPLQKAAQEGLISDEVFNMTPNQMQAFQYYYNQSADKLNLVNTVMLESTEDAYRATVADIATKIDTTQKILNDASGKVITGVDSFNKVQHDAVRRMVDNGLTGFIDHGGHHWSPEAYVAMDTRTTMTNTARDAVWEQSEAAGVELYQVSWHDGARPLCYPWQGKVISRNGWTGTVEDDEGNKVQVHSEDEIESFRYGGGLFGVNCGHYPIPFIPGFSRIRPPQQTEAENAKEYAESQQQRALERKVREEKRELEVMKAQGATQEQIDSQKLRVRNANAQLTEFCDSTGRARQAGRTYTPINASFPDEYKQTRYERGSSGFFNKKPTQPVNLSNVPPTPQVFNQGLNPNVQDHVENAVGVKKEKPMTIGVARTWTNPDYIDGKWEYRNNCQRCVQTYELRRRGYDVEAMPKKRKGDTVNWGSEIFNGYGKSPQATRNAFTFNQTEAAVKAELANAPEGARYTIYIQWKKSRSAHVFIAEKDNGVVKYLDPQTNKVDASDYFLRGRKGKFGFFRMDDKPITDDETIIRNTVRKGVRYNDGK